MSEGSGLTAVALLLGENMATAKKKKYTLRPEYHSYGRGKYKRGDTFMLTDDEAKGLEHAIIPVVAQKKASPAKPKEPKDPSGKEGGDGKEGKGS